MGEKTIQIMNTEITASLETTLVRIAVALERIADALDDNSEGLNVCSHLSCIASSLDHMDEKGISTYEQNPTE